MKPGHDSIGYWWSGCGTLTVKEAKTGSGTLTDAKTVELRNAAVLLT